MDNISISNLFPASITNKPIDAQSLYNYKEQKKKIKTKIDIDRLVNLREERKKKVIDQYDKVFNMCMSKVKLANEMNKFNIIYEVPEMVFGYFEYKPFECMQHIESKLKEYNFDTRIISNKLIFISWLNLKK
jgi:hypothetical protein